MTDAGLKGRLLTDLAGGIYSPQLLAEELGTNTHVLAVWRHRGTGPAYSKQGIKIYYLREDVEAWLRAGRRKSTRPLESTGR